MTLHTSRFPVRNARSVPHRVAVEPWGADFTLLPGESLEVIASGDERVPSFELVEWDDSTQVHCNDACTFEVMQGGTMLECGHNRQSGAD